MEEKILTYNPRVGLPKPEKRFAPSYGRLRDRILARQPLIFVDTLDCEYLDEILARVVQEFNPDGDFKSLGNCPPQISEYVPDLGSVHFTSKMIDGAPDQLRDFLFESRYENNDILVIHAYPKMFETCRLADWLRMIVGNDMRDAKRFLYVLIVGQGIPIPNGLVPYSARIVLNKPEQKEIGIIYKDMLCKLVPEAFHGKLNSIKDEVCRSLVGFSQSEINLILRYAFTDSGCVESCKARILKSKREMIKRIGFLELVERSGVDDEMTFAGLDEVQAYLRKVREIVNLSASERELIRNYGLNGILLVGMPGCGKSMAAKAARMFIDPTWPLIKLDIGRLLGKYVGESEGNLRLALEIAERVSPCILWIDELEKAFSGLDSSDGTSMRLFGSFLTWMQEKRESAEKRGKVVYVIATANNIDKLPDEFKRKGRFDEIFSILLPSQSERELIFKFHLQKFIRQDKVSNCSEGRAGLDALCRRLAKESRYSQQEDRGFSGADLATIVTTVAADSFVRHSKISGDALLAEIARLKRDKLTQRDLMSHGDVGTGNAYVAAEKKLLNSGFRPASKH